MYIFIFIALIIVSILFLLPIKIKISFAYDSNTSDFNLVINSLYGWLKYNYKSSLTNALGKIASNYPNKQDNKKHIDRAKYIFPKIRKSLVKHIKISEMRFKIGLGVDDAFITSIIISIVSIISGCFFSYLNKKILINISEMQMLPLYNSMQLSINSNCIIETKLGYIIIIIIRILMDKPKRGCENDGTTDSKSYENYNGKH